MQPGEVGVRSGTTVGSPGGDGVASSASDGDEMSCSLEGLKVEGLKEPEAKPVRVGDEMWRIGTHHALIALRYGASVCRAHAPMLRCGEGLRGLGHVGAQRGPKSGNLCVASH